MLVNLKSKLLSLETSIIISRIQDFHQTIVAPHFGHMVSIGLNFIDICDNIL